MPMQDNPGFSEKAEMFATHSIHHAYSFHCLPHPMLMLALSHGVWVS